MSAYMTTEELVNMDARAFGAAVNELDAGTCGRCARDLFHRLGGAGTFEEDLADVLAALLSSRGSRENQLVEAYDVAKKYMPAVVGRYSPRGKLIRVFLSCGRNRMVAVVEEHSGEIAELCRRLGVKRLEIFGSAEGDHFDPERSDVDFLVEFDIADPVAHARAYFALSAGLRDLFSRDVDLVEVRAVTNPYFLESINRNRRQIYAA